LLRQLLDVQEQERRMVSLDIHDGFAQDVVGALMHVTSIDSKLDPNKLQERVDMAASLLEKAIAECRRMIGDLRPMVLDDEGIVEAIKHLIADEPNHASLIVAFSHDVQFDRLEPKLEGVIFRIVQEALNNVKKHGQTDRASVELKQHNAALEVVVRDQGVGFDSGKVPPDRFGLRSIRERARLFGGTASIESAPSDGTTVYAQLPVVAAQADVIAE
jgi:signal transduction histidine kinase